MNSTKRELILIGIVIVLIVFFGFKQVAGIISECKDNFLITRTKSSKVKDLKRKEEAIRIANERAEKQKIVLQPFYNPKFKTTDSIASFGGMFEDIVDYVKLNGLMLRSIQYNINPEQDLIYKSFATSYNVCEVKLFVVGTYPQLKSFFNDLYSYPYYLNLSKVNIKTYESKPEYLLVNLSIDLYSKK